MSKYYIGPRDPQPKRRKNEDNPYNIFSVGENTLDARYFIEYVDGEGHFQQVEVSRDVYDCFNEGELQDLSYLNEVERHYEKQEQLEKYITIRAANPEVPFEDAIMEKMEIETLHRAISALPEIQMRRIVLYYFEDMTFEEIAALEGSTYQAIQQSIYTAKEKIKNFFKI